MCMRRAEPSQSDCLAAKFACYALTHAISIFKHKQLRLIQSQAMLIIYCRTFSLFNTARTNLSSLFEFSHHANKICTPAHLIRIKRHNLFTI